MDGLETGELSTGLRRWLFAGHDASRGQLERYQAASTKSMMLLAP
jgi:hypothetical protein